MAVSAARPARPVSSLTTTPCAAEATDCTSGRFTEAERQRMLAMPRLGPVVLERLEAAGFGSLAQLQRVGVEAVVQAVCEQLQTPGWRNRRRALERALRELVGPPSGWPQQR